MIRTADKGINPLLIGMPGRDKTSSREPLPTALVRELGAWS